MSYDIYLKEPITNQPITLENEHYIRGGTYCYNGTKEAWLNVTYNYAYHYYRVFGDIGIRTIYGLSGAESIPIIKKASEKLGDNVTENYWDATEGNAKKALYGLLALAQLRPDGIWDGD